MISLLTTLLVIQIVLPVLLYLTRDRLIFLPSVLPGPEEGLSLFREGVEARLVRIHRPPGHSLAAYDVAPRGSGPGRLPIVIFLHGNAGNIALRATLLDEFARGTGARTILFDYSGYGGNQGSPSEKEVYRDGLAVFDHLVAAGASSDRIVLYGESLGGAVALEVASRRPVAGVVVQSGFSSASSMALRLYPWLPLTAVLARGSFRNRDRVQEIGVPLLVVHGREDEIIPFAEGQRLYRAAPEGSEFLAIEGAGHNDLFEVAGPEYLALLGERFRHWAAAAQ